GRGARGVWSLAVAWGVAALSDSEIELRYKTTTDGPIRPADASLVPLADDGIRDPHWLRAGRPRDSRRARRPGTARAQHRAYGDVRGGACDRAAPTYQDPQGDGDRRIAARARRRRPHLRGARRGGRHERVMRRHPARVPGDRAKARSPDGVGPPHL